MEKVEPSESELLESMLKERDEKLRLNEQIRTRQEISLISLRSELHQMRIKQREESYWHRADMEKIRIEKETAEKRISFLDKKMHLETDASSFKRVPLKIDRSYVAQLQSKLSKSMQTIGILDNQVNLVKKSCDEVIKSLKLDMSEALDDRCKLEMDMLNQLSKLDNEKQIMEDELRMKLQDREKDIIKLKNDMEQVLTQKENKIEVASHEAVELPEEENFTLCKDADAMEAGLSEVSGVSSFEFRDLKEAQKTLLDQAKSEIKKKEAIEVDLCAELKEKKENIARLLKENTGHQKALEKLEKEKIVLRETIAMEFEGIMQILIEDRQEAVSSLERVAAIQEKSESFMQVLDKMLENVKPGEEQHNKLFYSTLEKLAVLNVDLSLSVQMTEMKLKNEIEKVKNRNLFLCLGDSVNKVEQEKTAIIFKTVREVQDEAITRMRKIEKDGILKYKSLEEQYRVEMQSLKDVIDNKSKIISSLKINEVQREQSRSPGKDVVISQSRMKKLQQEVAIVVERVQEKNDAICKLTTALEECKVREGALKRELMRSKKKVKLLENDDSLTALENSTLRSEF